MEGKGAPATLGGRRRGHARHSKRKAANGARGKSKGSGGAGKGGADNANAGAGDAAADAGDAADVAGGETKGVSLIAGDGASAGGSVVSTVKVPPGCWVCGREDDPEHTLLCDRCDGEFHMHCLSPQITAVPEGDWFCAVCSPPKPNHTDFIFVWKVPKVDWAAKRMVSPVREDNHGNGWRLLFYPSGCDTQGHASLFLAVAEPTRLAKSTGIRVDRFELTVLDQRNDDGGDDWFREEKNPKVFSAKAKDWGFRDFIPHDDLKGTSRETDGGGGERKKRDGVALGEVLCMGGGTTAATTSTSVSAGSLSFLSVPDVCSSSFMSLQSSTAVLALDPSVPCALSFTSDSYPEPVFVSFRSYPPRSSPAPLVPAPLVPAPFHPIHPFQILPAVSTWTTGYSSRSRSDLSP